MVRSLGAAPVTVVPKMPHDPLTYPSVPALFFRQAGLLKDRVALRRKRFGIWQEFTWGEFARFVRLTAYSLGAVGVKRGDRVAIVGENRPEWLFADLGTLACGGVSVGIYPTSSPEQVAYILGHSEAAVYVVEGEEQLDKALEVRGGLPHLQRIVVMDMKGLRGFSDPQVISFDEFLQLGRPSSETAPEWLDARIAQLGPDDLALVIYTSGTTGPPKGAMLTHRNLIWTAEALAKANPVDERDEVLSFLPLSHIAERMVSVYLAVRWGFTVNFAENTDTVLTNLREVSPTVLFAVPRIWEKIHSQVELHMREADFFKRGAYRLATRVGLAYARSRLTPHGAAGLPVSSDGRQQSDVRQAAGRGAGTHPTRRRRQAVLRLAYTAAHAAVLKPLKRRLGLDRVRLAISGAAPIAPDVLWYFHSIGVPIREVYGQTEGSGPTTIHQGDDIRLGTVGKPLPGVEVRLADDGEILVRGPNVFAGYYKDPEATAATLRDGWLCSGDIGEFDADGFLRIVDRKKDLFITAGGKNVAPQFIENKLKASPYIHDAVVIGDGRRYLVALIVIDEENVTRFARDSRIPFTTYGDLAARPEIHRLIDQEVQKVNRTLSAPEQVKRFAILPKRLYHEDGEVTPTLKVKRKSIMEKYRDQVEALYR
ncbi:MAG: AMP-binding protein [Bacillota bacterium]